MRLNANWDVRLNAGLDDSDVYWNDLVESFGELLDAGLDVSFVEEEGKEEHDVWALLEKES